FEDSKHVLVPKLGRLRVKGSHQRILARSAETRIGTVTITKDAIGSFFLSMQLASDAPFVTMSKQTNRQVGIDFNTENFLTSSDGQVIANPRYYRTIKGRLAKAQRILSRRARRAKKEHRSLRDRSLRESRNYQKQRLLAAKIYTQIFSRRRAFLHQLSTTLIKNHDLVVAEELRSKNMLKNHALAMSIAD
ncbi:RNA-guided endonuclease TnpB family protein, partial [Limosilactobacillus fermentum]|uniref:RNA-guided endonuclease TnpB family protein n=1 Tax=Limosilactobacillus fermentum TaxID=1613 RepID=UPI000D413080